MNSRTTHSILKMESQTQRIEPNSAMPASNGQISLENYLHFLHSHKQINLTVNHLNQIISIHGFKRLHYPKKVLVEAVSAIDLIDLSRSTRYEDVSSGVAVTLQEVTADLKRLNWQECCVTSIQTLNSYKEISPIQAQSIKRRKLNKQIVPKFKALSEIEKGFDGASSPSSGSVISMKGSAGTIKSIQPKDQFTHQSDCWTGSSS